MAVLISKKNDIMYHLACEEYLMKQKTIEEDILYIWYGSQAFVFGRNQNPFIEIHPTYLFDDSIIKVRRNSGGGTIYQDQGTINIAYITKDYQDKINNYEFFLEPIIDLLNELGIHACFKPKSHIFIDNHKISGNAQALMNHKLLHHGTILFNTNLNYILDGLVDFHQNAKGHQVLSNKSLVTNIKTLTNVSSDHLIDLIVESYVKKRNISLTKVEVNHDQILQLIKEKYNTWEWNYGKTPKFAIDYRINHEDVQLTIEKGYVQEVSHPKHQDLLNLKFNEVYKRNL